MIITMACCTFNQLTKSQQQLCLFLSFFQSVNKQVSYRHHHQSLAAAFLAFSAAMIFARLSSLACVLRPMRPPFHVNEKVILDTQIIVNQRIYHLHVWFDNYEYYYYSYQSSNSTHNYKYDMYISTIHNHHQHHYDHHIINHRWVV